MFSDFLPSISNVLKIVSCCPAAHCRVLEGPELHVLACLVSVLCVPMQWGLPPHAPTGALVCNFCAAGTFPVFCRWKQSCCEETCTLTFLLGHFLGSLS